MRKIGDRKLEAKRGHIGQGKVSLGPLHSLAKNKRSDNIARIYRGFTSVNVPMCTKW